MNIGFPVSGLYGANRFRAGAMQLVLSALVAVVAFIAIQAIWYPGALFEVAGGRQLFLLIAGVQLVLGPLIVFIIFVPGKKGLAFDLAVILALQVAALAYGSWVLFESRPAYLVFVKDRYELVRALDIPEVEIARAKGGPFADLPVGAMRIVGSRMPTNPEEVTRLTFAAASGVDLHFFPRYYVDYDQVRKDVSAFARPLAQLRKLNPGEHGAIDEHVRAIGKPEGEIAFLPIRAGKRDLTALVEASSGEVLKLVDLRPWEY